MNALAVPVRSCLLISARLAVAADGPAPGAGSPRLPSSAASPRSSSLRVGDTVRLGTAPDSMRAVATVAAIYEPRPDPAEITRDERHVRLHLPDLAALLGAPDRVDRFGIGLVPGIAGGQRRRRARAQRVRVPGLSPRRPSPSESSQTFLVVSRFHRAIAVITIVASAVFLLCIMLLKVEERRMDAAVMRFVGVRRRTIFGALLLEAALVAVAGSVRRHRPRLARGRRHQRLLPPLLRHRAHLLAHHAGDRAVQRRRSRSRSAWPPAPPRPGALVHTRPMVLWGRG